MRQILAGILLFLLTASPVPAADHIVIDDLGREVTLPQRPTRVVVMHEPLIGIPLMDLGLDLAGSYGRTDDGRFVIAVDFIDTVLGGGRKKPKGIGPVGQPDLEKLRTLKPDLIIGTELDAAKADQLSTIAPVYLQNVNGTKVRGVEVQSEIATLVKLGEVFDERKSMYLDRVESVRDALPVDPADQTYLPIFLTDQLNVVGNSSGMVQALEDLGYTRLSVEGAVGAASGGGSMMMIPLSPEALGDLNPDLLILLNSYMDPGRDEKGTRAKLDKIVPGWDVFLAPAIENRILFVDPAKVITPTLASAEHMLDAIQQWSERKR